MIDPGKMRHLVNVQVYNRNVDSHGDVRDDVEDNWQTVRTIWAAIDPVSGREFYEADQSQSQVTHKVRCRFFPGLTTEQRLVYHGRTLEIVSVIDWEMRHESYLIMAKELVP